MKTTLTTQMITTTIEELLNKGKRVTDEISLSAFEDMLLYGYELQAELSFKYGFDADYLYTDYVYNLICDTIENYYYILLDNKILTE